MALTIKKDMQLVRLIDSENDNPLELTLAAAGVGKVSLHVEDRDAGTMTQSLVLDAAELRAALALLDTPRQHFIED